MDQELTNKTSETSDWVPIGAVPDLVAQSIGYKYNLGTVREWARDGRVKSKKIGGRRFVNTKSLWTYIEGANG